MRQFYLETDPDQPPRPGDTVLLDRDESHHLFTVLRGGRDPELVLVDGRGLRMTGRRKDRAGQQARVEILAVEADLEEARLPRLVIGCAVVKGRRFEWALEKSVELGAHEFLPLATEFGVVDPGSGKRDRWRSLMISALKQSGRSWLPLLSGILSLEEVLARPADGPVLFGATAADGAEPSGPVEVGLDLTAGHTGDPPRTLTILVGPEGGWSAGERVLLSNGGARPVSLGPHVLRTETAALTGLALLQVLREQFRETTGETTLSGPGGDSVS